MTVVHLTDKAIAHFTQLILDQNQIDLGLRLFVDNKGTKLADINMIFWPKEEHKETDIALTYEGFTLYIEGASLPYLQDANIDYKEENFEGHLAISAPNLKPVNLADNLAEKIESILQTEINPSLASHGGMVSLIEITPTNEVILRFGGGCHGCGMADVTLKQGIEKTLKTHFPEITAVIDVTDHTTGTNPFY